MHVCSMAVPQLPLQASACVCSTCKESMRCDAPQHLNLPNTYELWFRQMQLRGNKHASGVAAQ